MKKQRRKAVTGREQRRRERQKQTQWRRDHPQDAQWQDAMARAALGLGPTWQDWQVRYLSRYVPSQAEW